MFGRPEEQIGYRRPNANWSRQLIRVLDCGIVQFSDRAKLFGLNNRPDVSKCFRPNEDQKEGQKQKMYRNYLSHFASTAPIAK